MAADAELLEEGKIKKTGEKRATTYSRREPSTHRYLAAAFLAW